MNPEIPTKLAGPGNRWGALTVTEKIQFRLEDPQKNPGFTPRLLVVFLVMLFLFPFYL